MRKLLFLISSIAAAGFCPAQRPGEISRTIDRSTVSITENNLQRLQGSAVTNSSPIVFTIVNGEEVFGSPFLFFDWANGKILTAAGRSVSKYMLRYDVYHQSVLFLNGKDSMEVSEEIKEFSLTFYSGNNPDSIQLFRFINGNQFKGNKEKNTAYYQLLYEDERGQLLKLNKKEIKSDNTEMPVSSSISRVKKFVPEDSYFFYDKKKQAFIRIKKNGSNIADILGLSKEQKEEMGNFNFSEDQELLNIFKKTVPLKAF